MTQRGTTTEGRRTNMVGTGDRTAETAPGAAVESVRATTTGVWPGEEPRQAASAGFSALAEAFVPVPLVSTPAHGGTRWAADLMGFAVQFLEGLPVDRSSFGWRLSRGTGADLRIERSRFGRTLDALGEYGEGFTGRLLLTLPGPWELVHALSLPDGNRVLGDHGARRDVVQSYAAGVAELRVRMARLFDRPPRVRLLERHLDAILTGAVPTVSGYATLPAVPDAHVTAALQSFLARSGPDTLLALPALGAVELSGKRVTHRSLLEATGASAVEMPLRRLDARGWEQSAELVESGAEVWLGLPPDAGARPGNVRRWIEAIEEPWARIGMGRAGLRDFGITTGWEAPDALPPLLPESADPRTAAGQGELAARVVRALKESE